MADEMDSSNPDLNATRIYYDQAIPLPPLAPVTNVFTGDSITTVTTINGASGPNINIVSSIGFAFLGGAGGNVVMSVSNAATVRSSISAAKSGSNSDITDFTALTGNTGFNAWTGTPDQASHATFSGTASAGYVQAEMQAVMDSLEQATGLIMALLTALLASGVIET